MAVVISMLLLILLQFLQNLLRVLSTLIMACRVEHPINMGFTLYFSIHLNSKLLYQIALVLVQKFIYIRVLSLRSNLRLNSSSCIVQFPQGKHHDISSLTTLFYAGM